MPATRSCAPDASYLMPHTPRLLAALAPVLLALAVALALAVPSDRPPTAPRAASTADDSIAVDLWLIGDAGLPKPGGEPVLQALTRAIRAAGPERALVVFLGDNIYPKGLPAPTERGRAEGERIMDAQIDAVREAGVQAVFVPGNHDWEAGAPGGWRTVLRQGKYIDERGNGRVTMLPKGGCPGPEVLDFRDTVRVVFLDTQWWLHTGPKPVGADSDCTIATTDEVVDSIRIALETAGDRPTVVVAHHPLVSGSIHGGYFDWPSYLLFPIPLARKRGWFAPQDIAHPRYRNMISVLERGFEENPPLLYAAGHDHNLQILRGAHNARNLVVSGAGIYDHTKAVRAIPQARYVARESGFMRLSVLRDGRVRLAALEVNAAGEAEETAAFWLQEKPTRKPDILPAPSDTLPKKLDTLPLKPDTLPSEP